MEERRLSVREFYRKVRDEYADPAHHPITAKALTTQARIVAGRLNQVRPRRVLDLGCGPAPVVPTRIGSRVLQVVYGDLVLENLAQANKGRRGYAVCLDARWLPFKDRSFDFLWCGLLADHIPGPDPWVEELLRVLMPGSFLGIACWHRPLLPADRYPADRMMRYTTASGDRYLVESYPTWKEVIAALEARNPRTQVDSFPIVPGEYVLEVAWLRTGDGRG